MTEHLAVYAIDDVNAPELQLHVQPGPGAHCVLFGWDASPPLIDAGPPPILEQAFAAALVRCGVLAFLHGRTRFLRQRGWFLIGADHWLRLPRTLVDRLRRNPQLWVTATSNAERARALFDDGMTWPLQAQLGLLVPQGQLPTVTRQLVEDVLGARNAPIDALRLPDGVIALALPGADGDFLEVVTRSPATRDAIRSAVASECDQRGVPFSIRPSFTFGATAGSSPR